MKLHSSLLLLFLIFVLAFGFLFALLPFPADATHNGLHLVVCGTRYNTPQGPTQSGTPIGITICTVCDFFVLIQTLFTFVWKYLAIPLAAIMILYGGLLMVIPGIGGEQSSGKITKGRKVIFNAIFGLVIVFVSWILVDSIMKILGSRYTNIAELGPWNEIKCNAYTVPVFTGPTDVLPAEVTCPSGVTEKYVDGWDVCNAQVQNSIRTKSSLRGEPLGSGQCNALTQYENDIQNALQGTNIPITRIKAIISLESGGNSEARGRSGEIGLMQVIPSTAQHEVPELRGRSIQEVTNWLQQSPANQIKAGVIVYANRLRENNGNHDRATRGYNGGPGANLPSRDCPGITRSECLYDNPEHTIPNRGYEVTRRYYQGVNACAARL